MSTCLIYPLGWSDTRVRETCNSSVYNLGKCELKWAYKLAIVQSITSLLLSILSFILATKTYQNRNYSVDLIVEKSNQQKATSGI